MRNITLLNEGWRFVRDAASAGEAAAAAGVPVALPHTWNAADGQDGGNDYHRGTCWYVRGLAKPQLPENGCAWLEFQGAAMAAEVWLNGERLARHEGGYSAFCVDITDFLQDENTLAVSVDNGDNGAVYPQKADFTFYGGLYRDVRLIALPRAHFALGHCGSPGIRVTPRVKDGRAEVEIAIRAENAEGCGVVLSVGGVGEARATVADGQASAVIPIENVRLWDGLNDPHLYTAHAALDSGDAINTRFGCRTFEADAEQGFLLNGRPYPLRGVSRHQDRRGVGNALTRAMHEEDMALIREVGANSVRLAHYQHDQYFYDLCDENGLVVWAEIPYITMHMPEGRENTLSQMRELVEQSYNHPSIVCWGLSNEITAAGGVTEDLLENHRQLNALCHALDATRPTAMAHVFMLETDSPILQIPDLNSYNLYYGWYLGELVQNERFLDGLHATHPNLCIGLSEYGADANPRFHAAAPACGDYTEEYQCLYHEHMLALIEARPWLWSSFVWNMFDFAADGRDEGGEHGVNQKGLVTMDRRLKKDAFYLYKAHWSKEPFVHLCGSRYAEREENVTEIKVYTNQPGVELIVDGKPFAAQEGEHVFRFRVPISGEHIIEARAGECVDAMRIRRVNAPNPDYRLNRDAVPANWFEKGEEKRGFFSIRDTLGELMAHPEAGAIVGQAMASAIASRGDVARSVMNNPLLKRMMACMPLRDLLKQAGDAVSAGQAEALNAALQKIEKPR